MRHSGLGIASLVIAVPAAVAAGAVVALELWTAVEMQGGLWLDTGFALTGGATCAATLPALAGLGLGVAALFQRNRRPAFARAGVILNGLILAALWLMLIVHTLYMLWW